MICQLFGLQQPSKLLILVASHTKTEPLYRGNGQPHPTELLYFVRRLKIYYILWFLCHYPTNSKHLQTKQGACVCKCLQISRFRPFYGVLERQVELFLIILLYMSPLQSVCVSVSYNPRVIYVNRPDCTSRRIFPFTSVSSLNCNAKLSNDKTTVFSCWFYRIKLFSKNQYVLQDYRQSKGASKMPAPFVTWNNLPFRYPHFDYPSQEPQIIPPPYLYCAVP